MNISFIGSVLIFLFLTVSSLGILLSANDSYTKLLHNKIVTMNATIDLAIQNKNIYDMISEYIKTEKKYKVYAYPDYKTFEEKIIKNSYMQKYNTYFVFITSNVSGEEDYTQKFKDYTNLDKDTIYANLNFKDVSSIYIFKGYKGFYQKIRLF